MTPVRVTAALVALALGLRQGEALAPPKSEAARRTIKPPDQVRDAVRAHRVRQHERRLAVADVREVGVFCPGNGRPVDARRDWQAWKALPMSAGFRDARLHDARHAAATMLLQQGVPARVAELRTLPGQSRAGDLLARGPRVGAGHL